MQFIQKWKWPPILLLSFALPCLSSCDKLQQVPQLKDKADPPAITKTDSPSEAPTESEKTPAPVVPEPTAEEKLANFQSKESHEITNADLAQISELEVAQTSIEELDLSQSRVTDEGLQHVQQLSQLTTLNLSQSQVRGDSLKQLQGLSHLTNLSLDATPFNAANGEALSEFQHLTLLSMKRAGINDNFYQHIADLPALEELYLDGNKNLLGRNFAELVSNKKLPNLRILSAGDSQFGLYGLLSIDQLKELEELHLPNCQLNLKAMLNIGRCPNLAHLNLSNNPLSNESLGPLKGLKKLTFLDISRCKTINEGALQNLQALRSLETLKLNETSLSEKGVNQLRTRLKKTQIEF